MKTHVIGLGRMLFVVGLVVVLTGCPTANTPLVFGGATDDYAFCIAKAGAGGFLLGGTSLGTDGKFEMYLVRTDPCGRRLWEKRWGDINSDSITKIVEASSGVGHVALANTETADGSYDGMLIRLDIWGNPLWSKVIGGAGNEVMWDLINTADGGYLAVGSTTPDDETMSDTIITKFDSDGEQVWQKVYGNEESHELALDVKELAAGGFVLVGRRTTDTDQDAFLWKLDADGNQLWEKVFGGTGTQWASGVDEVPAGGLIIAANAESQGTGDVHLIRTDADGEIIWDRYFGDSGNDTGSEVINTDDGGFLVVGTDTFSESDSDVFVLKVDADGKRVWEHAYGGADLDIGSDVVPDATGFVIGGYTNSYGAGGFDAYMIFIDQNGRQTR